VEGESETDVYRSSSENGFRGQSQRRRSRRDIIRNDLLPGAKSVISFAIRFFQLTLEGDKFGRDSELIPKGGAGERAADDFRFH